VGVYIFLKKEYLFSFIIKNATIHLMIITYDGVESVKVSHGDFTIAINPISKESKFKLANFGSDLVLITANHPDFNGSDTATRQGKEPFVIKGPGEYEVRGVFVRGFQSKTVYGGVERFNTVYSFELDGIRVVFLGAISDKDLDSRAKEELGDVDILFVPIGGGEVLGGEDSYKIANKREPKIIIPIHFGAVGNKDALEVFLKEADATDVKPVDKLTIKKKDLIGKESEVVVLSSSI
jgi:L-ascorbate metabolism protein UlaG (beta-lactamase superfamily)